MRLLTLSLAAALLSASPALADTQVFHDAETGLDLPADIELPDNAGANARDGKHPVIFLLHGCGGLNTGTRMFLSGLADKYRAHGFITVTPDSFAPRHLKEVCGTNAVSWEDRAVDLLVILNQLSSVKDLNADMDRVYAYGQSHGAASVLSAMRDQADDPAQFPKGLVAGFAYYPPCALYSGASGLAPNRPTFIFSGTADTLTPSSDCEQLARDNASHPDVHVAIYDGAYHGFDMPFPKFKGPLNTIMGYDAAATNASHKVIEDFFKSQGIEMAF
ncbi:MAG: dienelactone hydrolase family protein [Parvibaculaceae bacterium]